MSWVDDDENYEAGTGDVGQLTEKEDVLGPLTLKLVGELVQLHELLAEASVEQIKPVRRRLRTLREVVLSLPTEPGAPVKPLRDAIGFRPPPSTPAPKKKKPRS